MHEHLDQNTQLMNKRMIDQSLNMIFRQNRSVLENLAIGFIKIDNFEAFGRSGSHDAGEVAIQFIADILAQSTRPSDLLGRYDGEKFLFILNGTDEQGALSYAERIRAKIEQRSKLLRSRFNELELTVSIGVLLYQADYTNHSEMLEIATQEMRRTAKEGHNRVQLLKSVSKRKTSHKQN